MLPDPRPCRPFSERYRLGYEEGYKNMEYSGRTFWGYFGWLDGHDDAHARDHGDDERRAAKGS